MARTARDTTLPPWRRPVPEGAADARPDDWTAAGLKARCRALARHLEARKMATEAELLAAWQNDARGVGRWMFCLQTLSRFMGRGEARAELTRGDAAEDILALAQADAPEPVAFADGALRHVYAKAEYTLRWLQGLDAVHAGVIRDVAAAADPAVTMYGLRVASLHARLWAWVLTTPGPGLPFDDEAPEGAPEPPAWTRGLMGQDIVGLFLAHRRVNHTDLEVCAALFPPSPDAAGRLTLGGFLGSAAHEWGKRVSLLTRRWPLRELYAQAVRAARAAHRPPDPAGARAAARPGAKAGAPRGGAR